LKVNIMLKSSIIFLLIISSELTFAQQSTTAFSQSSMTRVSASDTLKYLDVPERPANAITGSAFVAQVTGLSLEDRERAVVKEILSGNIPSFSRKLKAVTTRQTINDKSYELNFFTVLDYMAIGSDQDYLYIPMTPSTAQYLAGTLNCTLPTKTMVDKIYNNAGVKLSPQPIPPSDKMTTIPVFKQHTDSIKLQISHLGFSRSADSIIAGHKKDIIISNKIYSADRNYERVVIYGWHLSKNNPIQPVYNGHSALYADYSHGVRLISNTAFLNGDSVQINDILKDPDLSILLSNEGVIAKPFYPVSKLFTSIKSQSIKQPNNIRLNQNYPNPFNPSTTIQYQLSSISHVDLSIFSMAGKKVVTLVSARQAAGNYKIEWNTFSLSSGIYIYTLKAGLYEKSRKMILLQ
jgi:Secretion system C-terminal sorting domain